MSTADLEYTLPRLIAPIEFSAARKSLAMADAFRQRESG
jgi:hypothetical protein